MCEPGLSVAEFLEGTAPYVRPVFERVSGILADVDASSDGDLIVDPLDGKVLFKNGPTFCILDVKTRWVAVGFSVRRRIESGRFSRKVTEYGGKFHHVVNVDDVEMIDAELADWLAESYHLGDPTHSSGGTAGASSDPMIPDDVDFEINPAR